MGIQNETNLTTDEVWIVNFFLIFSQAISKQTAKNKKNPIFKLKFLIRRSEKLGFMIKEDSTSLKVIVFAESVCKNNAFLLVIISIWIPFHALKRSNLTFKVEVNQQNMFYYQFDQFYFYSIFCKKCCHFLSYIFKG